METRAAGRFPQKRIGNGELGLAGVSDIMDSKGVNKWIVGNVLVMVAILLPAAAWAAPAVNVMQGAPEVHPYDYAEVVLQVQGCAVKNPFRETSLKGSFQIEGGEAVTVEGFCDAPDGSVQKIRFMPQKVGTYSYNLTYQEGSFAQTFSGKFLTTEGKARGLLRVDPAHPAHFIWEGTGEHYFWNGTTAYWLLGWEDDAVITAALDRLAALKVNRVRVAINGRTRSGERWHEPNVVETDKFKFKLNPWVSAAPDNPEEPNIDTSRYALPFWQKCERMLKHARKLDIVVDVIFYLDGEDKGVDPFGKEKAAGDEEKHYYSYAVNRLAAFSNVVWDISNEYQLFRDEAWVNVMGDHLRAADPYDHLTSVHGHGEFPFRVSGWADYCLYQSWDHHGSYDFMLQQRQAQLATGKLKPQINEEYGYEDHYPQGGGDNLTAPARSADNRRRQAWSICMAGGYQTTGERADQGTGKGPDTGGGWLNGRGDDSMVMLKGYAKMVEFFTSFDWWKTQPAGDIVKAGTAWCLAADKLYALYLPKGGTIKIGLPDGKFTAELYDCQTGERKPLGEIPGGEWTSPSQPEEKDWAILIRG